MVVSGGSKLGVIKHCYYSGQGEVQVLAFVSRIWWTCYTYQPITLYVNTETTLKICEKFEMLRLAVSKGFMSGRLVLVDFVWRGNLGVSDACGTDSTVSLI